MIGKAQKDNFDINKLDPETRLFKIQKNFNKALSAFDLGKEQVQS